MHNCIFALKKVETHHNVAIFIFRHVQVNNDSAIEFYKKFGFEIVETKKQYYKRIEPSDAYVLQKTLAKRDEPLALTNGPSKV